MFSKSNRNGKQLDQDFFDIGKSSAGVTFWSFFFFHLPVTLSDSEVIFINQYRYNSLIAAICILDGEETSSVVCCNDTAVVLSLNCRVFFSPVESRSSIKFSELSNQEIIYMPGISEHCLVAYFNIFYFLFDC